MNPIPPQWSLRGRPRHATALALAGVCVCLSACGGGSRQRAETSTPNSTPPPPPVDYRVLYPANWSPARLLPHSTYLNFLATGSSSRPLCPGPLLLVRRQAAPDGTLGQAVAFYNRVEQLRRPARRVLLERSVGISGASQALLIEATYPRTGVRGPQVHSYDLLLVSVRGVAFHVFASGCASDLPAHFVARYLLTFNADTRHPGQTPLGP
jgi:hypothetical protein